MTMQITRDVTCRHKFIYVLIGKNILLFALFILPVCFFTSSKILFLNKYCLVTVHFFIFCTLRPLYLLVYK